jgi:hypothetical protein
MGCIVFCDNKQPRGVLVDAVNDAGAFHAANAREAVATMGNQCVDQRAGFIAGAGVDHESCRLVDDDNVAVLEDNIQLDALWFWLCSNGRGQGCPHGLPQPDLEAWVMDGFALDIDAAIADKPLEAGAAYLREGLSQNAIEPACGFCCGAQLFG